MDYPQISICGSKTESKKFSVLYKRFFRDALVLNSYFCFIKKGNFNRPNPKDRFQTGC